jgi:dihydroorotase
LETGNFGFVDSLGGRLEGRQQLACELTVKNGLIDWDLNGITREDWQKRSVYTPHPEWDGTLPLKR